jgi:hypothetical protein
MSFSLESIFNDYKNKHPVLHRFKGLFSKSTARLSNSVKLGYINLHIIRNDATNSKL